MAELLKTIRNTSSVAQSIVYKGQHFVLGPSDEQTFEALIADKFVELCAPLVMDTSADFGSTFAPELQNETVWVANMTGNPTAPEEVTVTKYTKNKRWEPIKVINPNKQPRIIKREMKGGHRQHVAKDGGLVQESLPSTMHQVPPYRRVPMAKAIASWFLQRDGNGDEARGAVIESRPPSPFEPDMNWPLAEMRAYLRLIDPLCKLPIGDDELKSKAKKENWSEAEAKEKLRQAKQDCLKLVYFRVVDPRYRLPSRKEFAEFYSGRSEDEVVKQELAAILSDDKDAKLDAEIRKAGRPAKA